MKKAWPGCLFVLVKEVWLQSLSVMGKMASVSVLAKEAWPECVFVLVMAAWSQSLSL